MNTKQSRASIEQLLANFMSQHDNNCYRRDNGEWLDSGIANAHRILVAAQSLHGPAMAQFVRAYSYSAALDGGVHVTGKRTLAALFPDLGAQAPALGIKLFGRDLDQYPEMN